MTQRGKNRGNHLEPIFRDQADRALFLKTLAGSRKARPVWLKWERVYGELSLAHWKSK